MKFLFKWAFRLVIVLVVLVIIALLSLDSIIKSVVAREIRAQTGMDVKIGKFSFGLLSPVVTIEDFKLYNPAEFGGTPFLDIRELHVEYDREAMSRRELHITLLRLSITELNVVKNDLGGTNLLAFQAKPAPGKSPADEIKFLGIDVLNLSVGKMRFMDLKNRSRDRELYPNLQNQVFKNIKTTGDLYAILIVLWLRSGGGLVGGVQTPPPDFAQTFTLNCSPFLTDWTKPASSCGICSRSLRLTSSTGECM
jgi:hypothetical protein